jgi:thiamine-phosphate pyrophosphorylase
MSGGQARLAGLRLVAITDDESGADAVLARAVALASRCPAGALMVQVRRRRDEGAALYALAAELVAALRPHGALVVVNDRLDVALASGADGVHLPEAGLPIEAAQALGGPQWIVGTSRHSAQGAIAAGRDGAALVQLGPIWATPSKAAYGAPLGPSALTAARAGLPRGCRLVAVGGIDEARAALARGAGADAVAAIRAAWAGGAGLC